MVGLLLPLCVIVLGVAVGILVMLYAPVREIPFARALPRTTDLAVTAWGPARIPAVSVPREVAPIVAPAATPVAFPVAPAPVAPAWDAANPVRMAGSPRTLVPVRRPVGTPAPLMRSRAARGTEPPPGRAAIAPMALTDFIVDEQTEIDDEAIAHPATFVG